MCSYTRSPSISPNGMALVVWCKDSFVRMDNRRTTICFHVSGQRNIAVISPVIPISENRWSRSVNGINTAKAGQRKHGDHILLWPSDFMPMQQKNTVAETDVTGISDPANHQPQLPNTTRWTIAWKVMWNDSTNHYLDPPKIKKPFPFQDLARLRRRPSTYNLLVRNTQRNVEM